MTFPCQLCLIALAQKSECLHPRIPRLVHNSLKVSTTALDESVKVRPHGQKFSRTTWYNLVVRHKTCCGRGSVDGMGDVCRATFYVVRPRL